MKIALCNEVIAEMPFATQCAFAAALGYDGLEVAPFTLGETPHLMAASTRAEVRRTAEAAGLEITSLHWLLVTPPGLSINAPDAGVRRRTVDVLRRLVCLCRDLGGRVLVHGSHRQRTVAEGDDPDAAWARARETLAAVAEEAEAAGLVYCIEPLAPQETNFINTVPEAVTMIEAIGSPALRTMVDCSAATRAEPEPVADLLDRWLPTGMIGHIQVNDQNGRGPGQGTDRFAPVFRSLRRHAYDGVVAVEPFEYVPDGPAAAARAIGYVRGLLEAGP